MCLFLSIMLVSGQARILNLVPVDLKKDRGRKLVLFRSLNCEQGSLCPTSTGPHGGKLCLVM